MSSISISDIKLSTVIGVEAWEKAMPQTLLVSLEFGIANEKVFTSDDLNDATDYAKVVARVKEAAAEKNFNLIEAFAAHIAQLLLKEFELPWVNITVTKPAILSGVGAIGVSLRRDASDEPAVSKPAAKKAASKTAKK
jgi:dihydroneopterin aldolase